MIAGTPCFVGMYREFDRDGGDKSVQWLVFFDAAEGQETLKAMAEAAEGDCIVALNEGTMFLPDAKKAN